VVIESIVNPVVLKSTVRTVKEVVVGTNGEVNVPILTCIDVDAGISSPVTRVITFPAYVQLSKSVIPARTAQTSIVRARFGAFVISIFPPAGILLGKLIVKV
jgi:hypothetical protein